MPELHTLRNEQLTVTASSFGAELQSVTGADGVEYLWNGDPAYGGGRSPPSVSLRRLLRVAGPPVPKGEVRLPQHGLARKTPYETETAADTAVTYRLSSTEESRLGYPYDFVFRVRHSLDGPALTRPTSWRTRAGIPCLYGPAGTRLSKVPLCRGRRSRITISNSSSRRQLIPPGGAAHRADRQYRPQPSGDGLPDPPSQPCPFSGERRW